MVGKHNYYQTKYPAQQLDELKEYYFTPWTIYKNCMTLQSHVYRMAMLSLAIPELSLK